MQEYGYNFENYQAAGFGSTVTSLAWDAAKYATVRNPFFTRRIGTTGWDPSTSKVLSKLNWLAAPEADLKWKRVQQIRATAGFRDNVPKEAARRLAKAKKGTGIIGIDAGLRTDIFQAERHTKNLGRLGQLAAEKGGKGGIFSRAWQRLSKAFVGVTGETAFNPLEKELYRGSVKRHSGQWIANLVGKEATLSRRWAAGMYGLGRVATAANLGLLVWEGGKLGFGAVAAVANMGAQARLQPTRGYGTGIQTSPAAATMRQRAVMEMMGSEFGPRNVIGNEAPYLHV